MAQTVKLLTAMRETRVRSLGGEDPLEKEILLPGKFHGQRSLVGYSPWGHKEVDMTERLTLSTFNNVSNNANYSFVIFLSSFFFFLVESYQI